MTSDTECYAIRTVMYESVIGKPNHSDFKRCDGSSLSPVGQKYRTKITTIIYYRSFVALPETDPGCTL